MLKSRNLKQLLSPVFVFSVVFSFLPMAWIATSAIGNPNLVGFSTYSVWSIVLCVISVLLAVVSIGTYVKNKIAILASTVAVSTMAMLAYISALAVKFDDLQLLWIGLSAFVFLINLFVGIRELIK